MAGKDWEKLNITIPMLEMGTWGTERFNDLPKISQQSQWQSLELHLSLLSPNSVS